ncbi:hypothetical protein GCM10022377_18980 [Zhihengliuella alba]|uniref:Uncharacterized protein n=1 Tax=Zhihengliuella alba TaxID=547018 RepID=A0ABP7DGM6_9MICC
MPAHNTHPDRPPRGGRPETMRVRYKMLASTMQFPNNNPHSPHHTHRPETEH